MTRTVAGTLTVTVVVPAVVNTNYVSQVFLRAMTGRWPMDNGIKRSPSKDYGFGWLYTLDIASIDRFPVNLCKVQTQKHSASMACVKIERITNKLWPKYNADGLGDQVNV